MNEPADDKIKVLKMMIPDFDRVENIVGKEENAGYRHFLPFLQYFQRALYPWSSKIGIVSKRVNSLQNDKIQEWSKLKAPADKKINATEKSKFVSQRVENIVRKGENAGYQTFSPFPTMFSIGLSVRVVESRDCVVMC